MSSPTQTGDASSGSALLKDWGFYNQDNAVIPAGSAGNQNAGTQANDLVPETGYPRPAGMTGEWESLKPLKAGLLSVPSAVTGLLDIPGNLLLGTDNSISRAADLIGEKTGFQPQQWAEQTRQTYSPQVKQQQANINQAWADPNTNAWDIAKAYWQNPQAPAANVLESVPPMLAGGLFAKTLQAGLGLQALSATEAAAGVKAAPVLSNTLAAGIGEGSLMAGQAMADLRDKGIDPRLQGLAALGIGAVGGSIGAGSAKLADKLGIFDPNQLFLNSATKSVAAKSANRLVNAGASALKSMGVESAEEVAQTYFETGFRNLAQGKPFHEGMARDLVDAGVAGGLMGMVGGAYSGAVQNNAVIPAGSAGNQNAGTQANDLVPETGYPLPAGMTEQVNPYAQDGLSFADSAQAGKVNLGGLLGQAFEHDSTDSAINKINPENQVNRVQETAVNPVNAENLHETARETLRPGNDSVNPGSESLTGVQAFEVPLERITLSAEVPQFKSDANKNGIVHPLTGKFDRTQLNPVQLWERNDGRLELISGRHRFDLARRSGEASIPAQIHREKDGFTAQQAAILDAELNIRDNQGSVKDYVHYFRTNGLSEQQAEQRSLLRGVGRTAYTIARDATDTTTAAHRGGLLSDAAAAALSAAAPRNEALQNLGIDQIANKAKSIEYTTNLIKAVQLQNPPQSPFDKGGSNAESPPLSKGGSVAGGFNTADMFGFDDSAMQKAEQMAGIANKKQQELAKLRSALKVGAKAESLQGLTGGQVNVRIKNKAQLQQAQAELDQQIEAWKNWHTNPQLVAEINQAQDLQNGQNNAVIPAGSAGNQNAGTQANDLVPETGYPLPAGMTGTGEALLNDYTNQDILDRQAAQQQAQAEQAQQDKQAEQKRQADYAAGTLVDEMLGQGMTNSGDLMDLVNPRKQSQQKTAPAVQTSEQDGETFNTPDYKQQKTELIAERDALSEKSQRLMQEYLDKNNGVDVMQTGLVPMSFLSSPDMQRQQDVEAQISEMETSSGERAANQQDLKNRVAQKRELRRQKQDAGSVQTSEQSAAPQAVQNPPQSPFDKGGSVAGGFNPAVQTSEQPETPAKLITASELVNSKMSQEEFKQQVLTGKIDVELLHSKASDYVKEINNAQNKANGNDLVVKERLNKLLDDYYAGKEGLAVTESSNQEQESKTAQQADPRLVAAQAFAADSRRRKHEGYANLTDSAVRTLVNKLLIKRGAVGLYEQSFEAREYLTPVEINRLEKAGLLIDSNVRLTPNKLSRTAQEILNQAIDRTQGKKKRPTPQVDSGVRFARGVDKAAAVGAVLETETAERVTGDIFRKLRLGRDGLRYRVHANEATLPDKVKDYIAKQEAQGSIKGVYHKGTVHIISNTLSSEQELEETVLHEALGHYGARKLFGQGLERAFKRLYVKLGGERGIRALAARHGLDMEAYFKDAQSLSPQEKALLLTDELLAHLQGAKVYQTLPQRIKAAVQEFLGAFRNFFRAHGFKVFSELNDYDLAFLLKRMAKAATDPRGTVNNSDIRFIYGNNKQPQRLAPNGKPSNLNAMQYAQVRTKEFKAWFGDWENDPENASKVVDENGEPLVVYHGTGADFTEFKTKQDYRFGSHFGTSKAANEAFNSTNTGLKNGHNIIPVFLNIKNPAKMPDMGFWYPAEVTAELEKLGVNLKKGLNESELAIEMSKNGYDGVEYINTVEDAGSISYIVFNPNQIKSATGNSGAFDANNEDIRFSKRQPPALPPEQAPPNSSEQGGSRQGFALPEETALQKQQRLWQDEHNRWEVINKAVRDAGGKVTDDNNVYRAMERMPHIAGEKLSAFHQDVIEPLTERVAKAGMSLEDVAKFLYAQHAPERNAQMAKINPKFTQDNGSGMTNAEAAQTLQDLQSKYGSEFAELEQIANEFQAITEDSLQILIESGAISQEEAEQYRKKYKHYVPLKGFEKLDERGESANGTGMGMSTASKFGQRALGRSSKAGQILENIIRDHERALVWQEKAAVGRTLKQFIEQNPNTIGAVNQPPKQQQVRKILGKERVISVTAPFDAEKEIRFLENGKPVRIQLNDGLALQAYNRLGQSNLNGVFAATDTLNRFLRQMWTQKNPAFFLINPIRDVQTAAIVLTGYGGAKMAGKALQQWGGAWKAMYAHVQKNGASAEWQPYLERYLRNGGSVSTAYISSLEHASESLHRHLAKIGSEKVTDLVRQGKIAEAMQTTGFKLLNNRLFDVIENLNAAFEGATRLATFRAAVDGGMSDKRAAALSANVTVNFTKKGEYGRHLGAMYLFANANIQGTTNVFKTLTEAEHKGQAWAIVGGLVTLGFMAALLGGDDGEDELISDYEKERNISFAIGDGKRVTIPLPYGWSWFRDLGRAFAQMAQGGDAEKISKKLASAFIGNFSPIGNPLPGGELEAKNALVAFAPTAAKPFVMPAVNKSAFGSPLMPDSPFKQYEPDSEKVYRKTRGSGYDTLAKGLNRLTGGDSATSGWIDVSPETIKNTVNYIAGGAGRFLTDARSQAFEALNPDEELKPETFPVLKSFYKKESIDDYRRRFYEQNDRIQRADEQWRAYQETGNAAGLRKLMQKDGQLLRLDKEWC